MPRVRSEDEALTLLGERYPWDARIRCVWYTDSSWTFVVKDESQTKLVTVGPRGGIHTQLSLDRDLAQALKDAL